MKYLRFALVLFFLIRTSVDAQPLKCSVQAKTAILYNPDNGAILFEKQPHEPHYPASTMKIPVLLFILDEKKPNLDLPCIASKKAVEVIDAEIRQADLMSYPPYILEHDSVLMGIEEGQTYSLHTLLHAMLLMSANDAANVVAEKCSGSIEKFMEEFNAYLQKKGFTQTRFQNPHGLYHPAQMTTAFDMAKIAGLAFNNPTFSEMAKKQFFEGAECEIKNRNPLIKEGKYQYAKALGGKTGYTASSGLNLVAAAQDGERRLIAVLLGYEKGEDRFKDAITLFEMAFREKPQKRFLFAKEHEHFSRKVPRADEILRARLDQDVEVSYFPSEEGALNVQVLWDQLDLPISQGMEVGQLVVLDERGNAMTKVPLLAENGLEKTPFYQGAESVRWGFVWLFIGLIVFFTYKLFKQSTKVGKR